jgi:hypothetical protein
VSVRAFLALSADHGHLEAVATQTIVQAAGWFDAPVSSVYALGGAEGGQLAALVEFSAGQSALVTVASLAASASPTADVLVIGNHGTVHWDGRANENVGDERYAPPTLDDTGRAIRAAIRESLATSQPVETGAGK